MSTPADASAPSVPSTLRRTVDDGVVTIVLDRPARLNAMNAQMALDLQNAIGLSDDDRAIIVTGDDRAFCAGADLSAFDEPQIEGAEWPDVVNQLAAVRVPTIAAIEGYCLGGGLLLAMCCDLRVAGRSAVLGFPEIHRGFFPGTGATVRLAHMMSPARAKELMFLGEHIDAEKAERYELLTEVVDAGQALARARELAAKLAAGPPRALAAIKVLIDQGRHLSVAEGIREENRLGADLGEDPDEGVRAFLERRPPRFTGR
jgi:enoyl-CoA hydratase/carnithine racemase